MIDLDYWFNNQFTVKSPKTGRKVVVTVHSIRRHGGIYWVEIVNRKSVVIGRCPLGHLVFHAEIV